VPSIRASIRSRPPETVWTARLSSSIRACSETAKSTRSPVPPPSRTLCELRTRSSARRFIVRSTSETTATAAAPTAIHPAAVDDRCIYDRVKKAV
jgi:hypothetical protein